MDYGIGFTEKKEFLLEKDNTTLEYGIDIWWWRGSLM